jgi:D-serine deaminase-like pyridoxal phosphate-dependent protein
VKGITEARPGTYVFNDIAEIKAGVAAESDCALTVLASVISTPAPDRAVIDAGTKILSSDKAPAYGTFGVIKNRPELKLTRAYEEHGVITFDPQKEKLKLGDKIEIIPNHVCPVVNLVDEVFGVRKEKVETTWKVAARGAMY